MEIDWKFFFLLICVFFSFLKNELNKNYFFLLYSLFRLADEKKGNFRQNSFPFSTDFILEENCQEIF
jgi:hypothetical protein